MAKCRQKSKDGRSGRPRVVLAVPESRERQVHTVVELAREWNWDVLDLRLLDGEIPSDPPPAGALVSGLPTEPPVQRLLEMGCPTVRLGLGAHPRHDLLPQVFPDLAEAGRLAADHLAERLLRKVAFLGYRASSPHADFHPMYEGFRRRAEELGMTTYLHETAHTDEADESDADHRRQRALDLADCLAGLPKPLGVLTFSARYAAHVCVACRRADITIPEEVSILAYGDCVWCELAPVAPVALSAVEVRDQVLAAQAMRLLRRLMGGGPAPKEPVMIPPVRITERQSTNVLAVDDPTVARALRYIWNHIELDLSVDDIAREVGVPRYRLERGFRRYLQRGVNAELRRRRLDEFRRLLRSSDAPIAELSARIGFRSLESMHRCFRNAYGTTPGRYRREHVWREGKE